ncbi:MAG: Fic family protein [Oscillospiraceae bacterium]|nr:Fic family protein [Oscillospiraceae bacterium]
MIDAEFFIKILNDKNFNNLKKLEFKFGKEIVKESIEVLKKTTYKQIPIRDFNNNFLVYCPPLINISDDAYKSLLSENLNNNIEHEIKATLEIENIESSRNSIRNILSGLAPKNSNENKIYGIKKGLDFISDKNNKITKENLYVLYTLVMAGNLEKNEFLINNNYYRHDSVYIIGDKISHRGLDFNLLPEYMQEFINFINTKDKINIIIKSIIIHFYFSYIHPYFNGNGRMARLLQLWYLIQNNFNANLAVSFSEFISKTKNKYYKSFEIIEENQEISQVIDVTPFILYFNNHIFSKLNNNNINNNIIKIFENYLSQGLVTSKEKELFIFVLANYSDQEFSTKQIEKDYKNAAYATIRSFVIKFEKFGLLTSQKYVNKTKYKIRQII